MAHEGKRHGFAGSGNSEIYTTSVSKVVAQNNDNLKKLIASQQVNVAKSGAVIGTGTSQRIKLSTLYNAEVDKGIAKYNNEIAKSRNLEEANFSRIRGQMARQRAKMEQISIASNVGSSLLTMTG